MSQRDMYISLLTPCVIHILRAAGFQGAKPAALDTLVDLTARYLEILASKTADYAALNHNGGLPTTTDVRMALQYAGVLKPELNAADEQLYGDDDMRGVESFITYFESPAAKEIQRIAGLRKDPGAGTVVTTAGGVSVNVDGAGIDESNRPEDYLTVLKKKHSKTGDEARFQGTMLGRDLEAKARRIEGAGPGGPTSIATWQAMKLGESPLEEDEDADAETVGG